MLTYKYLDRRQPRSFSVFTSKTIDWPCNRKSYRTWSKRLQSLNAWLSKILDLLQSTSGQKNSRDVYISIWSSDKANKSKRTAASVDRTQYLQKSHVNAGLKWTSVWRSPRWAKAALVMLLSYYTNIFVCNCVQHQVTIADKHSELGAWKGQVNAQSHLSKLPNLTTVVPYTILARERLTSRKTDTLEPNDLVQNILHWEHRPRHVDNDVTRGESTFCLISNHWDWD